MQDTPAVKITYTAKVKVPKYFKVYMSANSTGVEESPLGQFKTYSFNMSIPIPSYLLAMAVGDLAYQSLGSKTGVITEPVNLKRCADELDTLQNLLDKAQEYLTPYIWGNYTILILPPSFPFGGMENPLLTFASPTIIVGDKSQVYVATHEICHSWTGNDVTCEDWDSFWLNEGFTVFEERKVSGELHGNEFALVEALLGTYDLKADVTQFGTNSTYTTLNPRSNHSNPDDAFSTVPYERGFQLLTYLENITDVDFFHSWIRAYILKYSRQSIKTHTLRYHFEQYLEEKAKDYPKVDKKKVLEIMDDHMWDLWINQPGYPPVTFNFSSPASEVAKKYA